MNNSWNGFVPGIWQQTVDVRSFIQLNYFPYSGDSSFLVSATEQSEKLWGQCQALLKKELQQGVLDIDTTRISGIDNFEPGYIDAENELIVGLQTDAPLKRILNPFGGMRMAAGACEAYGYTPSKEISSIFQYRKTHNEAVFAAYTPAMRRARSAGLLTGLPDAYGRGRIIGDYRRVPLYGTDFLIAEKKRDLDNHEGPMDGSRVVEREELSAQISALKELAQMAARYDCDIKRPASTAKEAVQWLYLAYLAAVKENNGAAMSLGRVSTFLDIYIERDLKAGLITETFAQELIDQLVMKLRLVRHLRTPEYNQLFAGDPNWITEAIGGIGNDGRTLVTKTSYRFLHTLDTLGPSPEPNMTVLWSKHLPAEFKQYCSELSIRTDALQYESDELMRPLYGDDYAIACCVSGMTIGKNMQFFGARCNLVKVLLYAINGGVDEVSGKKVVEGLEPIEGDYLDFETVWDKLCLSIEKIAELYVDTMNIIHTMHDRYAYEASQMALHDTKVDRLMAFGVAGLSIVADSLSAMKYGKVKVIREGSLAKGYEVSGEFPFFGNDDDRVDDLAVKLVEKMSAALKKRPTYRGAKHTLSVLTITSNLVYGKITGATPDGRKAGEPFAPGANSMHGRELNGSLASLNSVAKLPYTDVCEDGISNTFTIVPQTLGKDLQARKAHLTAILDGYFEQGGHHINVNVLDRDTLKKAMDNPDEYPNLTIRVSGYAVHFNRLTREQQLEVLQRTFHTAM
ncbi:formate C-acetyltransferase [Desulfosediminicola sp.]|uniref:formate C-acetyltransferase n=1 Tax=Desulfosediminicola sp. TaxID=2886825 RepID=UPI003AF2012C